MSEAQIIMQQKAKSFSMAAKFFSQTQWRAACEIYHWCRICDDVIDEGGSGAELEVLIDRTICGQGEPFFQFKLIRREFSIPDIYAIDLLEGMRMDVEGRHYQSIRELELYCYRVASTVGLMMCHVMGIYDQKALDNAAHLGMAMQMTNIARDIKEDESLGRCYLPSEFGADKWTSVKRLIEISELHYRSGLSGIIHLPIRSALAVLIAGKLYRQIGRDILSQGSISIEKRVVVSSMKKYVLVLSGILEILAQIPFRLMDFRQLVVINKIWRLQ